MLKVHHTEYPEGREPKAKNQIKKGGLWYQDEQDELLSQAKRVLEKPKRKDEVREFAIIFWEIVVALVCLYIVISKI